MGETTKRNKKWIRNRVGGRGMGCEEERGEWKEERKGIPAAFIQTRGGEITPRDRRNYIVIPRETRGSFVKAKTCRFPRRACISVIYGA